jgi:hypothetical protein
MSTAGRAVAFSGGTVMAGLLMLVIVPVPFIRSIGIAGMLVPAVSVVVTLTMIPVLLSGAGRRLDWPRLRREAVPARAWSGWARLVVRRRWLAMTAAVVILGVLIAAAASLRLGDVEVGALSQRGPARQGVLLLEHAGIPAGVLTPAELYLPAGASPARAAAAVVRIPGIRGVIAPDGPGWRRDGTAVVDVLPAAEAASPAGQAAAAAVRRAVAPLRPRVLTAGTGAGIIDQEHALYGSFPLMLAALAVITFVVLARAFRSLVLPAKAVLANLLSVAATYGALVLVWQDGYGSGAIWGLPASGAVTAWIPLFVFAFLYGLSMDYEVFLLARIREEYDRTGSTSTAVITGVARTGRLITCAALILFLAMAALASAPITFLKVFATGIGAGILLDATVVRSLLVPALVALLGQWNWWLPRWAARVLRVPPAEPHRSALAGSRCAGSHGPGAHGVITQLWPALPGWGRRAEGTTAGGRRGSEGQRYPPVQPGALTRRTGHREGAAQHAGPFPHVPQPAGTGGGTDATAVVGYHQHQIFPGADRDAGRGGMGMAGDVGQRLPRHGAHLGGDARRHRGERSLHADRRGETQRALGVRDELQDLRAQAGLRPRAGPQGEDRLADLPDRDVQLMDHLVDPGGHPRHVPQAHRALQHHARREQPLDDAVVQVPRHPLAFRQHLLLCPGLAQLGLRPQPAGDVAQDGRIAGQRAAGVAHGRQGDGDIHQGAVLAAAPGVVPGCWFTGPQALERRLPFLIQFLRDEDGTGLADDLRGAVAEEPFGGGVPGLDHALGRDGEHGVTGGVDDGSELCFRLPGRFEFRVQRDQAPVRLLQLLGKQGDLVAAGGQLGVPAGRLARRAAHPCPASRTTTTVASSLPRSWSRWITAAVTEGSRSRSPG